MPTPEVPTSVKDLSALLQQGGVDPQAWYGVWRFTDWLDLPLDKLMSQRSRPSSSKRASATPTGSSAGSST